MKPKVEPVKKGVLNLLKELERQSDVHILRDDYFLAVVNALVRLHPEVAEDSEVKAFWERVRKFKESEVMQDENE